MDKFIEYFYTAWNSETKIDHGMYFETYEDTIVVHHNYADSGVQISNKEFGDMYMTLSNHFTYLEPKFTGAEVDVFFISSEKLLPYISCLNRVNKFNKLAKNN